MATVDISGQEFSYEFYSKNSNLSKLVWNLKINENLDENLLLT